ncbi:MAG: HYR domain-containing protein [Bacteroidota bacterium]|nr:HYR domain-containing protein [Bacteroidota bacterium]
MSRDTEELKMSLRRLQIAATLRKEISAEFLKPFVFKKSLLISVLLLIFTFSTFGQPIYNVSGGGSYCQGGSGVSIYLSGSQSGDTYTLYKNGISTGDSLLGTGSSLTFNHVTAEGTYTIRDGSTLMNGNAVVTINNVTAGTIAGDQTICSGSSTAAFSSNADGAGNGTITYRWEINTNMTTPSWSTISGATGNIYNPGTLTADAQYRRVTINTLNNVACEAISNVLTVTVNNVTAGTIAGDQTICLNDDPLPFSSTQPGSGDGLLSYRWEMSYSPFTVWSPATGTNNQESYDPNPPPPFVQTVKYRRITTSTLNGVSCSSESNILTVMVQGTVSPGGISSNQTICDGEVPDRIISSPDGTGSPGAVISYTWEYSTDGGATYFTVPGNPATEYFDPPALTQTTLYRRRTMSTLNGVSCTSAATSAVTIIVQTVPTAGQIATDQTICNNSVPGQLTSVISGTGNPGATISYLWEQSYDGISWTTVPGDPTTAVYSPPALTQTTLFHRITRATLNGTQCFSVPTNTVTITVQAVVQPGIIASNQTICYDGDPSALSSTQDGSGSGYITYRWEISSGGGTWTTIPGMNGATYDPPGPLTAVTQYRRIAVSTLNSVSCESLPTSPVTITILPQIVPPTVNSSQTICYNTAPSPLTRTNATGGSGTFTYQWQVSTDNNTWTDLTGQSGLSYSPGNLTSTTYYRVVATSTGTPACGSFNSNVATITVRPQLVAPAVCCDQIVCIGSNPDPLSGTAASGGSGSFNYQWQVSTNGNPPWNDITGATNPNRYNPPAQSRYYRLRATDPICGTVFSNTVQVSLGLDFGGTFYNDGNPTSAVCPGYSFNYTITSGSIGALFGRHIRYSWSADPAYVSPATGGPVGVTRYYLWVLPYFQATIPFTVINNTDAPVTTTISVTPGVYNNAGPPPSGFVCNLTPQTFTVTINPFRIVCPSNIGPVNNKGGQCYASVATPDPTFIGNCTANKITWQLTGATVANSFSTGINYVGTRNFNIGVTTVTYTATNTYGVSTTCSYTVTIVDTETPVISCPGNITQSAASGQCSAIVNYTAPIGTDNCPGAVTTQIAGLPSGSAFPVGTTVNTFMVTDAAGNTASCSFNVTITDNQPPVFTSCPSDIARTTDYGLCTSTFDPPDPVVNDNCSSLIDLTWSLSGATFGNSPPTGMNYVGNTTFNIGTTTIRYTAIDPGGNSSVCEFDVVVTDNQNPTISCPSPYSVYNDPGLCSAVINTSNPVTGDNCGIQSLAWEMSGATNDSGVNNIGSYTFNVGKTTVRYIVSDNSGRTAECSFLVEVIDNESPVPQCPVSPQNRNADPDACNYIAVGPEFDPTNNDNCQLFNLSNNLNGESTLAGYVFPIGTTNVIWIVTDNAGNQGTCNFDVVVTDAEPPTISCPATPEPVCPDGSGKYVHAGPDWDATGSDNCGSVLLTWTLTGSTTKEGTGTLNGVSFEPGTTLVTWTAKDDDGNTAICTFEVIVGLYYQTRNSGVSWPADWRDERIWETSPTGNTSWTPNPSDYPTADNSCGIRVRNGHIVTVDGTPVIPVDQTIIDPGGAVTVEETGHMIVQGGPEQFIINSSSVNLSGSLIVKGTFEGKVTYNRVLKDNWNQHYISSPVEDNSFDNAGKISGLYGWNEPGGAWVSAHKVNFEEGMGYYLIEGSSTSPYTLTFQGSVINDKTLMATSPFETGIMLSPVCDRACYDLRWLNNNSRTNYGGGGWNLFGNPFTSAFCVETFLNANDEDGTTPGVFDPSYVAVYLWDGEVNDYKFIGRAIPASYGVGTPYNPVLTHVQVGQGFMIMANYNEAPVVLNWSMQEHNTTTPLKSAFIDNNWPGLLLKARYGEKVSSTLIAFNEKMTPGLDPGYDVGLFSTDQDVLLYTKLITDNGVNFARQTLPLPGSDKFIIPVGIDYNNGGTVIFSADMEPIGNGTFYLEDRNTGIFTDLGSNTYTVALLENTRGTGRFFVHSSLTTETKPEVVISKPLKLQVWVTNNKVYIEGAVSNKAMGEIYDILGRKIYEFPLTDQRFNTYALPEAIKGVYLIKVSDAGKTVVHKVVL